MSDKNLIKYQYMNYPEHTGEIIDRIYNLNEALWAFEIDWVFECLNTSSDITSKCFEILTDKKEFEDIKEYFEHFAYCFDLIKNLIVGDMIDLYELKRITKKQNQITNDKVKKVEE